jgi:NAD(P)-dependent dehydrogenase (short-subunit alcohol dehydrogenase family)
MKRVALVTGGTGELGGVVARAFAEQGYEVHVTSSRPVDARQTPPSVEVHVVNLLALEAVRELAKGFTEVHAIALCAGGFSMAALATLREADVEDMMGKNFKTAAYALAAFAPKLRAGAGVVVVGSQAYEGAAKMAPYAASKAAVVSLARSAAAELKDTGVHVNAVLPDTIDTPANRKAMPDADFNRWAKPEELSAVITWLCSPAASVVSGNAIRVGR